MARSKDEISGLEYGLGWSSFIPVLGLFLGLGAIVAGANKLKSGGAKLITLALLGILLGTVGSLVLVQQLIFHRFSTSAVGKDIHQTMAKNYLKQTVMALEYYKLVHGAYPNTLDEVKGEGIYFLHDGSAGTEIGNIHQLHAYALQPDGLHYRLMDTGPDGITGTADDIAPVMSPEELERTGYVKP
jgi:hypothetical protein